MPLFSSSSIPTRLSLRWKKNLFSPFPSSSLSPPINNFSLLTVSSPATPHPNETNNNNKKQDPFEEEPPLSNQLFKSPPQLGSYKSGDRTFYSLIDSYADSGDFRSLQTLFARMKRERRVFIERSFIKVFKAYGKAHSPEKAVELFHRMAGDFQCPPTVRSFNSVLNVVVQEGRCVSWVWLI